MKTTVCSCCSGNSFEQCCEPYLSGAKIAATPEQLMRSRYSAYALGNYGKYLLATWFPPMAQHLDEAQLDNSDTQWLSLTVLNSAVKGDDGEVSFEARYKDAESDAVMHENSVFKRLGKRWFYVGGEVSHTSQEPPKRNDLCPCGSGNKYKKCCL